MHCAGSENAVNLKELMAKLSAKKNPRLVVVCMKYGARQIAEKLKGLGAALVWVEADVMSQISNFERSLAVGAEGASLSRSPRSGEQ